MITPREAIQRGFNYVPSGATFLETVAAIALVVEFCGLADQVTTRQIMRVVEGR